MRFKFSERETARQAAMVAALEHAISKGKTHGDGTREVVAVEFWAYVVNAALAAIPERQP